MLASFSWWPREYRLRSQRSTVLKSGVRREGPRCGAHSVLRWYEVFEKQVESNTLTAGDMADAQFYNSWAAV
jgi:hypothetical protein